MAKIEEITQSGTTLEGKAVPNTTLADLNHFRAQATSTHSYFQLAQALPPLPGPKFETGEDGRLRPRAPESGPFSDRPTVDDAIDSINSPLVDLTNRAAVEIATEISGYVRTINNKNIESFEVRAATLSLRNLLKNLPRNNPEKFVAVLELLGYEKDKPVVGQVSVEELKNAIDKSNSKFTNEHLDFDHVITKPFASSKSKLTASYAEGSKTVEAIAIFNELGMRFDAKGSTNAAINVPTTFGSQEELLAAVLTHRGNLAAQRGIYEANYGMGSFDKKLIQLADSLAPNQKIDLKDLIKDAINPAVSETALRVRVLGKLEDSLLVAGSRVQQNSRLLNAVFADQDQEKILLILNEHRKSSGLPEIKDIGVASKYYHTKITTWVSEAKVSAEAANLFNNLLSPKRSEYITKGAQLDLNQLAARFATVAEGKASLAEQSTLLMVLISKPFDQFESAALKETFRNIYKKDLAGLGDGKWHGLIESIVANDPKAMKFSALKLAAEQNLYGPWQLVVQRAATKEELITLGQEFGAWLKVKGIDVKPFQVNLQSDGTSDFSIKKYLDSLNPSGNIGSNWYERMVQNRFKSAQAPSEQAAPKNP